ncbi:MAG: 8-oxo-dGTP diphosphatase MutT [Bdellovibrionales bacterium]
MEKTQGRRSRLKKIQWIPVVAGFLKKEGRILVGQRPENHSLAGLWEFPGGKIELGESPEEALSRELSEELGIEAQIGELKLSVTHSYNDVGIVILFYEVLYWKGEPKAKHHLMLEWIYPEELRERSIPDANKKVLEKIFKVLGVPWRKSS